MNMYVCIFLFEVCITSLQSLMTTLHVLHGFLIYCQENIRPYQISTLNESGLTSGSVFARLTKKKKKKRNLQQMSRKEATEAVKSRIKAAALLKTLAA